MPVLYICTVDINFITTVHIIASTTERSLPNAHLAVVVAVVVRLVVSTVVSTRSKKQ